MGFAFLVVVVGGAIGLMRWLRRRGAAPTLSTGSVQVPTARSQREAMEQAIAERRRDAA